MKVLVLLLAVAATAEVIDINYCDDYDITKCIINEIRIDPCTKKGLCKIAKGTNASISFDFTPNFSTDSLTTKVTSRGVTYEDLDSDGCMVTTCPTVAGTNQTYAATMHIGKMLPSGIHTFLWSVADAKDVTNQCCFKATVKLFK